MNSALSKPRAMAWVVWMIVSIFYAYQYILRVMPNIMLEDIMQQFHISTAAFGQFSGVYYIGYSLMHLPIGIMLDRYGPRIVLTSSILLTIVGLLPLLYAESWIYPTLGRLLIGMGSSAAILGVFKIIRMTFAEARFARMLGFSVMIGLIGAIYGGGPVNYMRETLGYQTVIWSFVWTGVALACITFFVVPKSQPVAKRRVIEDIREVLGNRYVVLCCLFAGMMVGPLEGFADVWGTHFLKQVYGYEPTLAASLPSMIFIGMCFGAPVLSFIAERVGNFTTIIGAGIAMCLGFLLMLHYTLPSVVLSLSFVIVGISCAYQILAIYQASTFVSEQVAGLTTAVANMIIMIFGYAFHTIIGSVINHFGGANDASALVYGNLVIPIALFIGLSGFTFLRIKAPKKDPVLSS